MVRAYNSSYGAGAAAAIGQYLGGKSSGMINDILGEFDVFVRTVDKDENTKLETMKRESVEERTVNRDVLGQRRALQIKVVRTTDEYVYLHCKHCGNSWGESSNLPPDAKFELQGACLSLITCRSCGSEWRSPTS